MPTLRITISGLCFFDFEGPLKTSADPPKRATLLLQRLNRAQQLAHVVNGRKDILDQHFPLLEFNRRDWQLTSSRTPDFLLSPDPSRPGEMRKGACVLFGDDLKILPDGNPLAEDSLSFNLHQPLSPQDLDTLWWMPTLEDAFPGHGTINPIHRQTTPGENQAILARLPLTQGRLKTAELSDKPVKFVPPGSSTFEQLIATKIKLEIPFSNRVEIEVTRDSTMRKLVLAPPPGGDLDIELKNLEIDNSIGVPRPYSEGGKTEADFEIYAQLLPPNSPVLGLPLTFIPAVPGNPAGVGQANCPPGG